VVVIAALTNAVVAAVKIAVAAATGSAAMLAEGIHSIVDTIDELLLWVGLRRSARSPDETHPYGFGKELYFWSLVVAMVVFGVGGGASIVEGIVRLTHPTTVRPSAWSYVVLAAAGVMEGTSFYFSWRELRRRAKEQTLFRAIRTSKDPSVFTVFVEDASALVGLVVAFLGIFLSRELHAPAMDAVASIVIGALLAVAALLLVRESRDLLVGESASSERVRELCKIAAADRDVVAVKSPLTMQLGPDDVLVNLEITFGPWLTGDQIVAAIERLDRGIRTSFPSVKHLFIEAQLRR
jgi:cation diffusion facilitator family transporter